MNDMDARKIIVINYRFVSNVQVCVSRLIAHMEKNKKGNLCKLQKQSSGKLQMLDCKEGAAKRLFLPIMTSHLVSIYIIIRFIAKWLTMFKHTRTKYRLH